MLSVPPTPTAVVGANVRRFREARGMSLAHLGRQAQLSKGTLTQLEAGRANPTIDTLHALSRALGTTLGELVADPADIAPEIVRADDGPRLEHWDGGARLLTRAHLASTIVEYYELELSSSHPRHSPPHAPGVVEHLFVASGEMRVGPEDRPAHLARSDFIRFGGDQPHRYEAVSDAATAVLTMFFPTMI